MTKTIFHRQLRFFSLLLLFVTVLTTVSYHPWSHADLTAQGGREFQMTMNSVVYYSSRLDPQTIDITQLNIPEVLQEANQAVQSQIQFLAGALTWNHEPENAGIRGGPRDLFQLKSSDFQILNLSATSQPGVLKATYTLSTPVLLLSTSTQGAALLNTLHHYSIVLPLSPAAVYRQGQLRNGFNACGDPHYQTQGDYFYFWSPRQAGCRLVENIHFIKIQTELTPRLENLDSPTDSPRYEALEVNGLVSMSLHMGKYTSGTPSNPWRSRDPSAIDYQNLIKSLRSLGYQSVGSASLTASGLYLETYQLSRINSVGSRTLLKIDLFYGESRQSNQAFSFFQSMDVALQRNSVIIYAGHSGLGSRLNPDSIRKTMGLAWQLNPSQYQMLYFDGCSSYSFYVGSYLEQKNSSDHNLDIFANTVEENTTYQGPFLLLKSITHYFSTQQKITYQTLLNQMNSGTMVGVFH